MPELKQWKQTNTGSTGFTFACYAFRHTIVVCTGGACIGIVLAGIIKIRIQNTGGAIWTT